MAPIRFGLAILALVALAPASRAQTAPASFIRGKITALTGHTLTVATREGHTATIELADPFTVTAVKAVELGSITKGDFVGIAAEPGPGGALHAQEVLVFPEAMRGTGEGFRPWDLTPHSTMTNATVSGMVQAQDGRQLELTYKGGNKTIAVPQGVPVVTLIPAQASDAVPGTAVFLSATKKPDGTYAASRITIGKGGVAPPM
ncbi:MAG: hypothetical protein J2P47_07750 [Acetobacteraceae bacterium]|nr:hypothetical protein [Acetobacteraceae bacterium]